MAYKDAITQAVEALAAEVRKPRRERLTRAEIAHRAGVSVPLLDQLKVGKAPRIAHVRLQAILRVLAEGQMKD